LLLAVDSLPLQAIKPATSRKMKYFIPMNFRFTSTDAMPVEMAGRKYLSGVCALAVLTV
jgi:hypothetical protein